MLVREYIDTRVVELQKLREETLKDNPFESSQRWVRIDELKKLKDKFSEKGVWLI